MAAMPIHSRREEEQRGTADATHGLGGLKYDPSKKARPQEFNVFIALIAIVVAFELLGRLIIGESFLFNTREGTEGLFNTQRLSIIILQVATVGIIAMGVTQVIITGGIDLSSGSVVGATAMVAMSFAQTALVNGNPNPKAIFGEWAMDLPVSGADFGGALRGPDGWFGQRGADRLYQDPAVYCDAGHDGFGAGFCALVVHRQPDFLSRPKAITPSAPACARCLCSSRWRCCFT